MDLVKCEIFYFLGRRIILKNDCFKFCLIINNFKGFIIVLIKLLEFNFIIIFGNKEN